MASFCSIAPPAATPRILWVELTSRCPFDCVFCSRKSRRGVGGHMPFSLFESLVGQVSDPRKFLLNYSGESTVYPELIPAIRLARSTGAAVELVSALASAPEALIEGLAASGLTRLTVSIHAADSGAFARIYRHSSFAALRARLERFVDLCRGLAHPPAVDVAFVAMERNLGELAGVTALAAGLGLHAMSIFPVIRRDELPEGASGEPAVDGLRRAIDDARARFPEIAFTVCNPAFTMPAVPLGEAPVPCPGNLPAAARIHSCEQNPWETAHILSNGDVVACEVHDKTPLGCLARQSLAEIWHGEPYRRFRARYVIGDLPECRTCVWKTAYLPGRRRSEIVASRGRNAQLLHGWHEPSGEPHIWSSQQALAVLEPRRGSRALHVNGLLPPGPAALLVRCNGADVGTVTNTGAESLHFGIDFPIAPGGPAPWQIEFRTTHVYRPADRGDGTDGRDLGFALHLAVSKAPLDPARTERQAIAVRPLIDALPRIDRLGRALALFHRRARVADAGRPCAPGLSVIVPERDNPAELEACLSALGAAAERWDEPFEAILVVNGAKKAQYRPFLAQFPSFLWQFHPDSLSFSRAVRAGLRAARFPWVYLLNSDVALEPAALAAAGRHRSSGVFSIASQIVLKDPTRFREETNWTTLFLEDGIASAHDLVPPSACLPTEHFYSGGGASIFQRAALLRLLDASAYDPFYWEDVEWGWRARKLGYRAVFCPASVARHTQGATISRLYSPDEIESIRRRNRLLFHLRNLTAAGSLPAVADAIARSEEEVADYFRSRGALAAVARGRLWNHLAPVSDDEVLATA